MKDILKDLSSLALKYAKAEGQNPTPISYFEILKSSKPSPIRHGILQPSFCVILQGNKKVFVGDEVWNYGPGIYLASIIDIPVAGQIVGASPKNPYLGLRIEYTAEEITSVLMDAKIDLSSASKVKPGAFMAEANDKVLETFLKLFSLMDSPDASYLSQLLKKELIYHLLMSDAGPLFAQNLILSPSNLGLGKAINWLRENFDKSFTIEDLAKKSNMSVSSLHHKFKTFASMGPLQYQKQLRLQEARRLLMNGEEDDATNVALRVGYESPSQFSREYKRLFGLPPIQDAKVLKKITSVEQNEVAV